MEKDRDVWSLIVSLLNDFRSQLRFGQTCRFCHRIVQQDQLLKNKIHWLVNSVHRDVLIWASRFGHQDIVEWMIQRRRIKEDRDLNIGLRWAAREGHRHLIHLFLATGRCFEGHAGVTGALLRGDTELVDYIRTIGCQAWLLVCNDIPPPFTFFNGQFSM